MQYEPQLAIDLLLKGVATKQDVAEWYESGNIPDNYLTRLVESSDQSIKLIPAKKDPLIDLLVGRNLKAKVISQKLSYPYLMRDILNYYRKPDSYRTRHLDNETRHQIIDQILDLIDKFATLPTDIHSEDTANALKDFLRQDIINTNGVLKDSLNTRDLRRWLGYAVNNTYSVSPDLLSEVYRATKKFIDQLRAVAKP